MSLTTEDAKGLLTVVIQEALDKLGSTPDEIAATLEAKGIKGKEFGGSYVPQDCPISNYLKEQFPEVYRFLVSPGRVAWYVTPPRRDAQKGDGEIIFDREGPLSKVIRGFDNYEYPELVR